MHSRSLFVVLLGSLFLTCAGIREKREREEQMRIDQMLQSSAAYYEEKGRVALSNRDFNQAVEFFRTAATLVPFDPQKQTNLGVAFYKSGQLDSALFYYQKAVRLQPAYIQAYTNLGYLYLDQKKYGPAERAAEQALSYDAAFVSAYTLLAQINEKTEQFEKAEDYFVKAVQLDSTNHLLLINLGVFYYERGQLNRAIQSFERAAQLKPSHAETYFFLGNTLARKCKLDDAQTYYEKALRLDPNKVGALNNHGLILVQKNRYEEALTDFYHALSIDSTASPILFNLSFTLESIDEPSTALSYINRAISIDTTFAMFYLQRGNIYMRLGQMELALKSFNKAIELDSGYALVYNNLGNALLETNEPEQAELAYQRAVFLYPEFIQARYFAQGDHLTQGFSDLFRACVDVSQIAADIAMMVNNLGKARLLVGQRQEAEKNFKRAIELQPRLVQPFENLALLYQQQGKVQQAQQMMAHAKLNEAHTLFFSDSLTWALEACDRALALFPTFAQAWALKGRILFALDDSINAHRTIKQAIQLEAKNPAVRYMFAEMLSLQKNYNAAATQIEQAVQLDPEHIVFRELYATILDSLHRYDQAAKQRAYRHYLLGKKREFVGQWDLALEEYETAAGLTGDNAIFLAGQGLVYVKKRLYMEAELFLEQALEINPNEIDALYGMGLLCAYEQDYEQAANYFERALEKTDKNASLYYAAAINYHNLGQPEKAREHLEKAQSMGLSIDTTVLGQSPQQSKK